MSRAALFLAFLLSAPIGGAETILIEPGPEGQDTAVYHFQPFLTRGDRTTLYAFTISLDDQAHDFRTFVKFDLPEGLEGACVEEAKVLLVYAFDSSGFGTGENVPGTLTCEPVLASWDEMTMTWANQPPIGAPLDVVTDITSFQSLAFEVGPLVQSWIDGAPNHGVAIRSPTTRAVGFYSFEAGPPVDPALRPALAITLAEDPQACPEPAGSWPAAIALLAGIARKRAR